MGIPIPVLHKWDLCPAAVRAPAPGPSGEADPGVCPDARIADVVKTGGDMSGGASLKAFGEISAPPVICPPVITPP